MRLLRYLFLPLLILVTHNIVAEETCCWRHVKTEIAVPPNVSPKIIRDTWDSVFSSREYGGGPELTDCPLSVEVGAPKTFIDYVFQGKLSATQTRRGTNQFALTVQLVDKYRGKVIKNGQTEWFCLNEITCAKALQENVKTLAMSFQPLDDILHNYERMPESAQLEPEKDPIMAGKKTTIHIRDIVDSRSRRSQPWQRILVKAEKGEILNGTPQAEDYRVFEVGDGSIDLIYKAPDECRKQTETITIDNSCNNDPRQVVNFIPEREIASEKFDILCDRWEGTFTYTEQVSGLYAERKANRLYSMTIKATFDLKKADEDQIRYESEDASIDLHDSFQQNALAGLQESWNASKQGRIPMKVTLEFSPKAKDDPSDLSLYNIVFGEWEGSPVMYTYKSKLPLFGQDCEGRSEQTHGALYMLQDMTAERCIYEDKQRLFTGDYSWNDPLSSSVRTAPWDCPDVMGLPVSIPNMIYHKHLKWEIQKLSK